VLRLARGGRWVRMDAGETTLQFAPIAFDASTFEIWGTLLNGARLAVVPAGAPSLEELGAMLQRHAVTTLWLTAGLFHQVWMSGRRASGACASCWPAATCCRPRTRGGCCRPTRA
jgi:non-ribosomal peptide synthetase component F